MPLGAFEREVLRLIAKNRNPDSFVAGATILHRADESPRASQDIDLFHDTEESIVDAVRRDSETLRQHGYRVEPGPPQPTFQRALIFSGNQDTKLEWVFDSAFRFFPVEPDPELGWALNFWDAATNKVLAQAARNEFRDYLDVLHLHQNHLPLGALAWAASGKDGGLTPDFILEEAQRHSAFPKSQVAKLQLTRPVDLVALKQLWLQALREARDLIPKLPAEEVGCLYLNEQNQPVTPDPASAAFPKLKRHFGSVRGAWPVIRG